MTNKQAALVLTFVMLFISSDLMANGCDGEDEVEIEVNTPNGI